MSLFKRSLEALEGSRKMPSSGTVHYELVTGSAMEDMRSLPTELAVVFQRHPGLAKEVREFLARGGSLGVRSLAYSPEHILAAVRDVAVHTQHRLISPWLRPLLLQKENPTFTAKDRVTAGEAGVDLDAHVEALNAVRSELKNFVLIDDRGVQHNPLDIELLERLNTALEPAALEYAVNRIEFDNANERTAVAQAIIKALLVIGPIAHLAEKILVGIGKVIAASTDDVLSEFAELTALRASGFTWRQLLKRSRILIPIFALATYGAFEVEVFVERGDYVTAGLLFGLSAVALSLTTALQSVSMYKQCVDAMVHDGKLDLPRGRARWAVAIQQDFANPARLGLLIGACMSPLAAITVFVMFPDLTRNGWILALLGTTETVVAGSTVMLAKRINDVKYARRVLKT